MSQEQPGLRKGAVLVILATVLILLLSACGGETPTSAPTQTAAATTKAATSTTAASTTAGASATAVKTVAAVPNGDRTGVTDTEIKLGASGPLTGAFGFLGTPIRVMDGYFKMINDQGGIYGRKINYIMNDDGFERAKSLASVKKLIEQDRVLAFAGVRSPVVAELRDYLVQQKMPVLPFITSSSLLYDSPQKLVFGLLPPLGPEAKFVVDYATQELGAKKLAILYQADNIGIDALKPFLAEAQAKQVPVVAQLSTSGSTPQDVDGQLATLRESGADFLYLATGNSATLPDFLKQLDSSANKPKVMLSYYLADPSFYPPLGKAAEGIYSSWFALPPDSDDIKSVQYRDFMKKYLPEEQIGYLSQEGYIMAQVTVEALRRAGKDLSRESFISAAESIVNWRDSYANNITYGPLNRSPINSFYVTRYQDGKIQKISDWYNLK